MRSLLPKLIVDVLLFQVIFWVISIVFEIQTQQHMPVWILVLLIVNALCYVLAAFLVIQGNTVFEYGVAVFLLVNIAMTIFDQVGTIDLVILVVNVITLGLLIWLLIQDHQAD